MSGVGVLFNAIFSMSGVGVVHKKMPYDGVQVCIRTIQVRTQVYKASMSACSCTVRELKIKDRCHCKRS